MMDYHLKQRIQSASKPERKGHIHAILPPEGIRKHVLYRVVYDRSSIQETHQETGIDPEGTPTVWRDDTKSQAVPSVLIMIEHARDVFETESIYTVCVRHVNTFHGRGFMAALEIDGRHACNGQLFLGVSKLCHERSLADGREVLQREIKELEDDTKTINWKVQS